MFSRSDKAALARGETVDVSKIQEALAADPPKRGPREWRADITGDGPDVVDVTGFGEEPS